MKTLLAFFLIFTVSKASAWNDIPKGAFLNKVYNCSSSQTQFPVTSVNQGPPAFDFSLFKTDGKLFAGL